MQRIRLNKGEKRCLKVLYKHGTKALDTMPRSQLRRILRSLQNKGLVKVAWIEGGDYKSIRLTRIVRDYFVENPKLYNPIDWKWWIATLLSIATLTVAIIALFIACNAL